MREVFREVREVFRYRELLRNLVLRDLKVRYRRSILGFVWVMLNPLLMMGILSIVFSQVFNVGTEHYTIYLLSGIILWNFFAQSTSVAVRGFLGNSSLIKKIYVPKSIFPLSNILSAFVNFLFSLVPLGIIMVLTDTPLSSHILALPVCLILLLAFTIGVSLILSTLTVFFHDMVHIYEVLLLAWMYATPVFYPESIIPERFAVILKLNPLYHLLNLFRGGIYLDTVPVLATTSHGFFFSVGALLIGYGVYARYKEKVVYHL